VIPALLVGWGVIHGLDRRRTMLLLLVLIAPVPLAGLLAVSAWRARPRVSTRAATFCDAVAGELRSGSSLRYALERAAASVGAPVLEEMSRSGASFTDICQRAEVEFAEIGLELGAVIDRISRLGSPAAALFDEMGAIALAQVEVAHEIATAAAPARATAFVLLAVPMFAIGSVTLSNRLGGYLSSPPQRVSALVGLCLVVVGLGLAGMVLRKSK
jgi:Flp pilus assembly protein TadB